MAVFSLNEFYQRNRKVVIWVILVLLLWALRDFFAVVLMSFVLAIGLSAVTGYATKADVQRLIDSIQATAAKAKVELGKDTPKGDDDKKKKDTDKK